MILAAVTAILLARLLPPHDRGIYAFIMAAAYFGNLVGCLGTQNALGFMSAKDRSSRPFYAIVPHWIVMSLAVTVAVYAFLTHWLPRVEHATLIVAVLAIPLIMVNAMFRELALGKQLFLEFNLLSVGQDIANLLLLVLVAFCFNAGLFNLVTAFALSVVVLASVSICMPFVRRTVAERRTFDVAVYVSMLRYGLRSFMSAVLEFGNMRATIFLLIWLSSAAQAGLFSVAMSVAVAILAFPSAAALVLVPATARSGRDVFSRMTLICRINVILVTVVLIFLVATREASFVFVFGEKYAFSMWILLAMVPGLYFSGVARIGYGYLMGANRPEAGVASGILGLAANWGVGILLIPGMGALGAGVGYSAASVVGCTVIFLYLRKDVEVRVSHLFIPRRSDMHLLIAPLMRKIANQRLKG